MTKIEWTHIPGWKGETLNCITGCTAISSGCRSCYARRMTKRLQAMYYAKIAKGENPGKGLDKYKFGFDKIKIHPKTWQEVSDWKKPRSVFLNSMSDTFHQDVPYWYIDWLFENMNRYDQHIWQVLTKRSKRMEDLCNHRGLGLHFTSNIWMGVTVENEQNLYRIDDLRAIDAQTKFLSCEPLLESLKHLALSGISWCIVGAETGPGARYMNPDWAREIRDMCREHGVAFFMKHMSNKEPIPDDLMIREFPERI